MTVLSDCALDGVEGTEVSWMTLAKLVVSEIRLLATGVLAAGPLRRSQRTKILSSRNEELTSMEQVCVVPLDLLQVLLPPRQLGKGMQTKQVGRKVFSNLDSLRLIDLMEVTC